jgi:hypothetical protein
MIQLITNKDGVVSIVRENILNVQNDIPRYVEYVDSALISNYDSIDILKFKDINPIISIVVNSSIMYRVELKINPELFLKSIIRDKKLNDLFN